MATLDLDARPEAVPAGRGFARGLLREWAVGDLADDVELLLSELLANTVLHAPGPVRVVVEREGDGVRVEVRDSNPVPPVRRVSGAGATTGRGLNLVTALSSAWGVRPREDGEPGKTVWSLLREGREEQPEPAADLDALLAAYDDEPEGVHVEVGEAPVELLLAAKDHLDGVLREIALEQASGGLPVEVVELMAGAVRRFSSARTQLRTLLTDAQRRGDARASLVFRLPLELADAGEQYLEALRAADTFARDRRMLSLESPVEHRVLREWYVRALVAGLRRAAAGQPPVAAETFEQRLLEELHALELGQRRAAMGAALQQVTARLAAAETVQEIADIAVREGVVALGAAGGTLTRLEAGAAVPVAENGADAGVGRRYLSRPQPVRPSGPSSHALRTGEPVWVEGRQERDRRFPGVQEVQPDAVALAALPLLVAGRVVGALRFSWPAPHVFSQLEREFLQGLAVQTGQAVARADALRRLQDLRDELDLLLKGPGRISGVDLGVLRTLYGDAPVGIAVYDGQGRYLRVNEVIAAANGRSAADHVGQRIGDVVVPGGSLQERQRLEELLARVLSEGTTVEQDVAESGPDGVRHWGTSWFPVRDADDRVQAAVVLAVDITAQRAAEARTALLAGLGDALGRLRTAPEVLEAVADAVVPALGDLVAVHLVTDAGRVWCPLVRTGDPARSARTAEVLDRLRVMPDQEYGPGRVLRTGQPQVLREVDDTLLQQVSADDQAVLALLRELGLRGAVVVPVLAGGRTVGALSVARSGTWPGPRGVLPEDVSVLVDIGRQLGAALEDARALSTAVRLELALDAADIGSYEWHVRSGRLDWDERLFSLLDVDPDTFDGTVGSFFAQVHPEDRERVRASLEHVVAQVGEVHMDYRVEVRNGPVRWIEARGRALPGVDGATERVVGTAVDVTARRDADAQARRTLELMADAFFSLDRSWRFTYLNREAERVLDRDREQLLGSVIWEAFPEARGSRFEQEYRQAVATGRPARFEQWFPPLGRHFEVRAFPAPDGLSVYFADVAERRSMEYERDRALGRLNLLNEIGEALTATLDVDEALARLAGLLVPALGDLVSVDLRDAERVRGSRVVVLAASDPAKVRALEQAEALLPRRQNPRSAVHQVLAGAPAVHVTVTPEYLAQVAANPSQLDLYLALQLKHAVVVPLPARGSVLGALTLFRTGPDARAFDAEDVTFVQEVGRRAGQLVDNAAQYTAQRDVAEGLQRSLLPELPVVPGIVLGAAYEPSSSATKVGGDWYDAFVLPDGGMGLVIGDVMGHDIAAAAAMGQLRSVLRTCAADGDPPALVLDRLDRLVSSFAMADLATVVYARLDRRPDRSALLSWANAGHPPPLLLDADGEGTFLEEGGSVMIGAPAPGSRGSAQRVIPPGSTLLMFTDGLVERRGHDLDDQLRDLADTASRLWRQSRDPETLCRGLLSAVRQEGGTDDAAAVALTLL